ncbi:ROK family transcriptional regulator [Streptomyces sp. C10-9-1]|uniref:ROK family transcriptional regulator n=1 Tax=Streptomyces sp. C10-9-1 TaxID=1859285 RepID=UPI0021120872|nr:ROK family transcriptional regulator [Streptomyces sp. C10-9-1]MCQ6556463.1 ROK family transcriptional regulator [Streptomyces sp. C10-9-1]
MAASPSTARAANDRLALDLLQQEGALTAGQLKNLTGLSRPTVADLVERLGAAGLVHVVGEAGTERRGPNARLYGIVADRAHLAALDVRTGGVAVVVTDLVGTTLREDSLPIGGDAGTGPAVEQAVAFLEGAVAAAGATRLHGIGVGAPGLVDPATGELRDTSGLPAWHRRLLTALRDRLGARVLVENETNLAALAEQRTGAARDRDSFAFLWLGHGVGAALFLDGRLRRGASGGAGEIGFLPVPGTGGLPSAAGCEGGFHSLAGAEAVCALGTRYGVGAEGADPALRAAGTVARAVETGREDFLEDLAGRLAVGAAAVASVLDPGCVVLGGEVGLAGGGALAARVQRHTAALSPLATEVRAGVLGGGAVLDGALRMAQDAARDELFAGA